MIKKISIVLLVVIVLWISIQGSLKTTIGSNSGSTTVKTFPSPGNLIRGDHRDLKKITQLIVPDLDRKEVVTYTVQVGDNVFSIAQMFNIRPTTIIWGNEKILSGNPHRVQPGMVLNILPVDGIYYEWEYGDDILQVSNRYKVTPEAILNWSGNHIQAKYFKSGMYPLIDPGTMLVIPGGQQPLTEKIFIVDRHLFEIWELDNIDGQCSVDITTSETIGTGSFTWPIIHHNSFIYDTSQSNKNDMDLVGQSGDSIYAADTGVIIFSGWSSTEYGNTIVIDHGNGWQTLYGHLNTILTNCGQIVHQKDTIGTIGMTDDQQEIYLHFELASIEHGRVVPLDYLPNP